MMFDECDYALINTDDEYGRRIFSEISCKKKDTESVPKLIIMQMQLKLNRTEQASGTVITENHSLLI